MRPSVDSSARSMRSGPVVFALVSGSFGGGQQVALHVAQALVRESVPIAACAPSAGPALDRFHALGGETLVLGELKTRQVFWRRSFRRWLVGTDARCLYTHTVPAHEAILGSAVAGSGIKLVVHRHILGSFSDSAWKRAAQMFLWKRVMRQASAIVCVSSQVREQIRQKVGVEPRLVHNGVPIPAASPVVPRPPVVGFVGRLDPNKRVEDFIALARDVRASRPASRFLLVGTRRDPDDYERRCIAMISDEGMESVIEVRPFVEDVQSLLLEIDILVLPSVLEGHPLIMLEAMALARVVVAADIPGCRETITDGVDGRLFRPTDRGQLAKIVLELIDDDAQRHRLGHAARATVTRRFHVQDMVERLVPLVV